MSHLLENIKVWIQYNAALWRELHKINFNTARKPFKKHGSVLFLLIAVTDTSDPHHIPNHMVVNALRSVDPQDPEHNKNHCPGVH